MPFPTGHQEPLVVGFGIVGVKLGQTGWLDSYGRFQMNIKWTFHPHTSKSEMSQFKKGHFITAICGIGFDSCQLKPTDGLQKVHTPLPWEQLVSGEVVGWQRTCWCLVQLLTYYNDQIWPKHWHLNDKTFHSPISGSYSEISMLGCPWGSSVWFLCFKVVSGSIFDAEKTGHMFGATSMWSFSYNVCKWTLRLTGPANDRLGICFLMFFWHFWSSKKFPILCAMAHMSKKTWHEKSNLDHGCFLHFWRSFRCFLEASPSTNSTQLRNQITAAGFPAPSQIQQPFGSGLKMGFKFWHVF